MTAALPAAALTPVLAPGADTPLLFEPEALLAALPGPLPTGPHLQYDRVMADIRHAREADDPSLPQGDWERPLKKADWPGVVLLCTHVLRERSKDLQVAAWLTDAWVHLHGLVGLKAGITVLTGLVAHHWDGLHPQIDGDDVDARTAPLYWLNEALPLALKLDVTLLRWPERRPPRITLDDWDRSLRADDQPDNPRRAKTPPADPAQLLPSREDMLRAPLAASVGGPAADSLADLQSRRDLVRDLAGDWARFDALVDQHLGQRGPSLARVGDTLAQLARALDALIAPRLPPPAPEPDPLAPALAAPGSAAPAAPWLAAAEAAHALSPLENAMSLPSDAGAAPAAHPTAPPAAAVLPLRSRADAYAALSQVAEFLQRHEPHSPTPYLVRRAVRWGQLPLPELMQEMLREEGDIGRLMRLLGLPDGH